ncbi:MAG: DUF4402 domain-containing protein [Sphingomicrobium sp.]
MTNLLRMTAVAAVLALTATPALAAPTTPDKNATATAKIVKPLTLAWVQDLDLGTVLLAGSGAWTGATVGISKAGVFSCSNTNVTCSGANQVAKYKVTGTNNQVVTINAGNVVMTNQNDNTKSLQLTVDNPGTVNLGNSGNSGLEFALGGSISVDSTTADGTYSGTFNVTVNY